MSLTRTSQPSSGDADSSTEIHHSTDMSSALRTVQSIERPDRSLLTYYTLFSLCFGPLALIVFPYLFFRFRTMRYVFDDEGVSMRWGALFRREISLTYARIQDIHLVSNAVERHLGLARLKVQTAAGSATAEMTIEGLREFELVRDVLYERMRRRGRRGALESDQAGGSVSSQHAGLRAGDVQAVVAALRETTDELRSLRRMLAHDVSGTSTDGTSTDGST
ncbi:MAG: PH domain-containing protein [Acidobacteriota bacterium]